MAGLVGTNINIIDNVPVHSHWFGGWSVREFLEFFESARRQNQMPNIEMVQVVGH